MCVRVLVPLWSLLLRCVPQNIRFQFPVSQCSAETLVKLGGKINYLLIDYFPSNISSKDCQKWLVYVEVIVKLISEVLMQEVK